MKLEIRPYPPFVKTGLMACTDVNPDIFYPKRYRDVAVERARRVCRTCPLVSECAAWAIKTKEPEGIWGGLAPADREGLVKTS